METQPHRLYGNGSISVALAIALGAVLALSPACTSPEQPPPSRGLAALLSETGDSAIGASVGDSAVADSAIGDSVIGIVVDAATGHPMDGVHVHASDAFTFTDSAGGFVLRGLRPGSHTVTAAARPYRTARHTVVVPSTVTSDAARRPPVLRIALRLGPPPQVSLAGRWILEMTPDPALAVDAATAAALAGAEPTVGMLTLRDTTDAGDPAMADGTLFRFALGTFVADIPAPRPGQDTPGAPVAPARTTATEEEARGAVFFSDSVVLAISPSWLAHPTLLRGSVTGDAGRGIWEVGSETVGRWVMRRTP